MSKENEAVILSAVRTPIARFQGGLSSFPGTKLGAVAVKAAVERAGIENKEEIDEVFMGMVVPAGQGQAPARQAAIFAGLPPTVSATTFNKVCGSGLKTAMLAAQAIKAGDGQLFVAGGMELMTRRPIWFPAARGSCATDMWNSKTLLNDGLWDPFEDWAMGNAADFIAEEYEVTREAMDRFAAESQQKAAAAIQAGKFKKEIVPVEVPGRKGQVTIFDTAKARARTPRSNCSQNYGLFSAPTAGSPPEIRPA